MESDSFLIYAVAINLIGFLMGVVNHWLSCYPRNRNIHGWMYGISVLGGSLGIILHVLLFDRKAQKSNIMLRVFVISMLVIQLIVVVMIYVLKPSNFSFRFWLIFYRHQILLWYGILVNVVTFLLFAVDKFCAVHHKRRMKITVLLLCAFLAGSLGALAAMYVFRHKTKKDYFTVGVPLMIVIQVVVLFFLNQTT